MDVQGWRAGWEALGAEVGQELATWREAHPRATLAEIEEAVLGAVGRLQARALEDLAHASAAVEGSAGPLGERPRCPDCGGALEARGRHEREVLVARQRAPLRLRRRYAACPACGGGLFPLDEELGLLPGELSPGLDEGLVRLATWMPFGVAVRELAFFWRVPVSEATVRRHAYAAGGAYAAVQTAEAERIEREQPAAPPGPAVQLVSADGAMVPVVGGEWAEAKTLAVGTVEAVPQADGTTLARARELSYFSRVTDAATFGRLALAELHARGTENAGLVVAPLDGAEWLQGLLDLHRPDAVRVLDFPHAVQHLGSAAQAAWGVGTGAAAGWLAQQARALKHAGPDAVLAALRALPAEAAADPAAALAARAATLQYLEKRREQLRYPEFRARGLPIGSGSVESANKLVVQARLKGAGMRWARGHLDPMLALRTVACSGRWGSAWPRITAERRAQRWRRRAARRHARQRQPPARPAPPTRQRASPEPPRRLPPRPTPTIVNGRPTPEHPWKQRPLLAGGVAHLTNAKS
jgi:hypothetical protein